MQKIVVNIAHLTRSFGQQHALDDVSLKILQGQVFGIVGENGAGKTTLIKHILGMYKAQKGDVSIFGMNPVEEPVEVLSRIGYLSEEPELPNWMTIEQLLKYTSAFYPTWDDNYAHHLVDIFNLDINKKVKSLSKGQKARTGLCLAQAYKPDLLLLDEPSSGLDPNVRRDILSEIIKTVSDEGRTVIFSSHLLEEVERVSDHVLLLDNGKVILTDAITKVLEQHFRVTLQSDNNDLIEPLNNIPGVYNIIDAGNEKHLEFYGIYENLLVHLKQLDISVSSNRNMSLNDIFISRTHIQKSNKNFLQDTVVAGNIL